MGSVHGDQYIRVSIWGSVLGAGQYMEVSILGSIHEGQYMRISI